MLSALLATLLTLSGCFKDEQPEYTDDPLVVHVGDPLPEFQVQTLDSITVTRDSLLGTTSVITFFSTTCSDCHAALPKIQQAYENPDYSHVRFLCISREETADVVRPFWQSNGFTMPCAPQADRTLYNKFAKRGVPLIIVANGEGEIVEIKNEE